MKVLECDVLGVQLFDQIGGFLEWHVAIVVAMDQQHGRAPVRDGDKTVAKVTSLGN